MGNDADRRRPPDKLKTRGGDGTLSDGAFDRWFRHQVHRIYDDAMAEPIPADLAEILERFPSRRGGDTGETNDDHEDGDDRD